MYARVESALLREFCRQVFFAFAQKDRAIVEMVSKKANLEDVFIELTEDLAAGSALAESDASKKEEESKEVSDQ